MAKKPLQWYILRCCSLPLRHGSSTVCTYYVKDGTEMRYRERGREREAGGESWTSLSSCQRWKQPQKRRRRRRKFLSSFLFFPGKEASCALSSRLDTKKGRDFPPPSPRKSVCVRTYTQEVFFTRCAILQV